MHQSPIKVLINDKRFLIFTVLIVASVQADYQWNCFTSKGDTYHYIQEARRLLNLLDIHFFKFLEATLWNREMKGTTVPYLLLPFLPWSSSAMPVVKSLILTFNIITSWALFKCFRSYVSPLAALLGVLLFMLSDPTFRQLSQYETYPTFIIAFFTAAAFSKLHDRFSLWRSAVIAVCIFLCISTRPCESLIFAFSYLILFPTKFFRKKILFPVLVGGLWWVLVFKDMLQYFRNTVSYTNNSFSLFEVINPTVWITLIAIATLSWRDFLIGPPFDKRKFSLPLLYTILLTATMCILRLINSDYFVIPMLSFQFFILSHSLANLDGKRGRAKIILMVVAISIVLCNQVRLNHRNGIPLSRFFPGYYDNMFNMGEGAWNLVAANVPVNQSVSLGYAFPLDYELHNMIARPIENYMSMKAADLRLPLQIRGISTLVPEKMLLHNLCTFPLNYLIITDHENAANGEATSVSNTYYFENQPLSPDLFHSLEFIKSTIVKNNFRISLYKIRCP